VLRKKILIINPYPPQYSFGGPVISINNLVKKLNSSFDFIIIAPHNFEVTSLAKNDSSLIFVKDGNASINFSRNFYSIFIKLIRSVDVIYLNSVFEPRNFIIVIISKLLNKKIILSSRGQLSNEALRNSNFKFKIIFINIFKAISHKIKFISSDESENLAIKNFFNTESVIIPNIINLKYISIKHYRKKFIFFSRITKKKNLKLLLETINEFKIPIELDIFGFVEDLEYWSECEKLIENMPNIFYKGIIKRDNLSNILKDYTFFIFPTLNENYGHVIVESFFYGLIPIVSNNTTPFSNFISKELDMGFDLNKISLKLKLERLANLSDEEIDTLRSKCKKYCEQLSYLNGIQIDKYKQLFYE
jgi:glycosyltransferase involved in cell wall biosynthesis